VAADRGRSRRVNIPGVAELLRPAVTAPAASDERLASGREKHDNKITVYLSGSELLDLEHARLALRRYGYAVDRGRLVREAIAILLADLDARGASSVVVRRLGARDGGTADGGGTGNVAVGSGKVGNGASADGANDAGAAAGPIPSLTWGEKQANPR
jgi:hypothetical protein